jgi:phosphonopyruvate decarboxylase
LEPQEFFDCLKRNDMKFFAGVPDSLLKDFCAYVTSNTTPQEHVIAVNEGHAVTLAAGYHLATGKVPVVYMQNSGFGNAVNPLLSLCDPKVYSIPMLLLIGWRGEPGKKDEPQHLVQGKVMTSMLSAMDINYEVLPDYIEGAEQTIATAKHFLSTRNAPYALLVKRQNFNPFKLPKVVIPGQDQLQTREEALALVLDKSKPFDAFVSTTGFASREVFEYRKMRGQSVQQDFLVVGSMGYASAIAQGVAMAKPSRQVFCLDGDGAFLMHMGAPASIGTSNLTNYKHIVINNGVHDSVGGQPTVGFQINIPNVARACGYTKVFEAETPQEITDALNNLRDTEGPAMLHIKVKPGARSNLGRPTSSPVQNKAQFMNFLQN